MSGTRRRFTGGVLAFLTVLAGAVVATPAEAAPAPCDLINHRRHSGVHINLWLCYGLPGSHGPMYHAQIANADHNDMAILRYRTTQNSAWIYLATPMAGQDYANTGNVYAGPDEVQACLNLALIGGGYEFACAWTRDDGDT